MNATMFLSEWIVQFLKHKDLVHRRIVHVDTSGNEKCDAIVTYRDKETCVLCGSMLKGIASKLMNFDKKSSLYVCIINSKENVTFLLSQWEFFVEFVDLTICFVNPFTNGAKRWILKPFVHNKISEGESLKTGLMSLFEGVTSISEKEFKKEISD